MLARCTSPRRRLRLVAGWRNFARDLDHLPGVQGYGIAGIRGVRGIIHRVSAVQRRDRHDSGVADYGRFVIAVLDVEVGADSRR